MACYLGVDFLGNCFADRDETNCSLLRSTFYLSYVSTSSKFSLVYSLQPKQPCSNNDGRISRLVHILIILQSPCVHPLTGFRPASCMLRGKEGVREISAYCRLQEAQMNRWNKNILVCCVACIVMIFQESRHMF
jgi:hypothetical protein